MLFRSAIADGSHLALHPVRGLERVPQCRAEIGHECANMVAGGRRPQPSQRRHEILFDLEANRDLAHVLSWTEYKRVTLAM